MAYIHFHNGGAILVEKVGGEVGGGRLEGLGSATWVAFGDNSCLVLIGLFKLHQQL